VERQLAHLGERRLPHLLAERVADLDREQPRERVEIAPPLDVLEIAALAAHDDGRLTSAHAREVQPEVLARCPAKVKYHVSPSRRVVSTSRDRRRSPSRRHCRARASGW